MKDLIEGVVLLKDNRNLSRSEFLVSVQVCKTMQNLVEGREEYIKKNNLDRDFCIPAAFWALSNKKQEDRPFQKHYKLVVVADYNVLNRLRLFTGIFTGYSLSHLCTFSEKEALDTLPRNLDDTLSRHLNRPDDWVLRWLEAVSAVPLQYIFNPPCFLGEIGWNIGGVVVNHDTYYLQEMLNLFYESGVVEFLRKRVADVGHVRILEIGGGYGALAHAVKKLIPNSEYWICDLPESLLFSSLYLTLSRPDNDHQYGKGSRLGFTYLPNYMFHLLDERFDVVINRLSLSEMTEHQIRTYAQKISSLIGNGIFIEQNCDNRHLGGCCAELILGDYFPHKQVINPKTVKLLRGGTPNIWTNQSVELCEGKLCRRLFKGDKYGLIRLVNEHGDYNIVQIDDNYIACLKELGPINLGSESIGERDLPPYFYVGSSVSNIISKLDCDISHRKL